MHFGDWLKRYRSACHLTQEEVSEALGYAEVTYRRVERGGTPSSGFIDRLIKYLQLPIHDHATFRHFALTHDHPDADALLIRLTETTPPPAEALIHVPTPPHQATPPPPTSPPSTNFVGRQDELDHYAKDLTTRHLTVISGMTGVGKTALAGILARQYASPDHIFWYRFYPQTGIHDLLWRLTAFLAWHGEDALWKHQHATLRSEGSTLPVDAQIEYLIQALQGHPFLLCFDDLHYVETNSYVMSFIDRLLPILNTTSNKLIVTARLHPAFAQLCPQTPLVGLSLADTQMLLTVHDLTLKDHVITNLHQITAGNPALLILAIQALRTATNAQIVVQDLVQAPNVVHYLMTTIHAQLAQKPRAIQVMRAIAVLQGTPTTREAIEVVLNDNDIWEILYDLRRRYLIQKQDTEEAVYTQHTLIQAFYYDQLGQRVRRTMHLRAAQYYTHEEHTLPHALVHFEQAHDYQSIIALVTNNLWGFINQGYAQTLNDLLTRLNNVALSDSERIPIWLAQGTIATFLRISPVAHESYQRAWDYLALLPDTPTTRQQRVQVCQGIGDLLEYEQPQEAIRWLSQGLRLIQSDHSGPEAGRLYLRLGAVYTLLAEYIAAQQALTDSLQLLPTQYEHERAQALTCQGVLACMQSNFQAGQNYFTQAIQIYQRTEQPWNMLALQQNMCSLLEISGAWTEATTAYTQALILAERLHHVVRRMEITHNLGILQIKQGHFANAHRLFTQSLDLAHQHQLYAPIITIQTNLANLQVHTGNYDAAVQLLSSAMQLSEELDVIDQRAEIARTWALIHLAKGNHDMALAPARESVQQSEALEDQLGTGISLRVLGQVQCTQGMYDDAHSSFMQSLALVQSDPYETAQTQASWGKALLETHQITESAPRLQQAQSIFENLGATHDLKLVDKLLTSPEFSDHTSDGC